MGNVLKIAEIVARLCNDCFKIAEDGKVTILDFPAVLNVLNEISEIVGVDKLAVLTELDAMSHDDIDMVVDKFSAIFVLKDQEKKDMVVDLIRVVLDLGHCIDSVMDSFANLNG